MDTHESGLLSHVQLVKSLANSTESDMDRAVEQVLDSAQKLVENFSLLREQLVSLAYYNITRVLDISD